MNENEPLDPRFQNKHIIITGAGTPHGITIDTLLLQET